MSTWIPIKTEYLCSYYDPANELWCVKTATSKAVTRILNIMGVDDTVAVLRSAADKLEKNRTLLESRRNPRPTVRA